MPAWRSVIGLALIVTGILCANRLRAARTVFRWLPVPLWCYALPMIAVALGWLPREPSIYRGLTDWLLPFALSLLLLGVDLSSVMRTGRAALLAVVVGAAAIVVGAPLGTWLLHNRLPPDAWKGAATLAATWTGGTMNLLSLRTVLQTPDAIFAPLIIVDAMMAYSWMAVLVLAAGFQQPINRWLHASTSHDPAQQTPSRSTRSEHAKFSSLMRCALVSLILSVGARLLAGHLPVSQLISSPSGWTVLLVTTGALSLALIPSVRGMAAHGGRIGYPFLYLVLAATGAQARLDALWSAPAWLMLGAFIVLLHGGTLLLFGRLFRVPLGLLATASQANIGGVVSAPLVGAVYSQRLAPIGLLLAIAGNAVGTYLGLLSASMARWVR